MKKTLIFMAVAVLLGSLCGKALYLKYKNASNVFNEGKKLYFLQEGVYSSKKSMEDNTKDINPKLVIPSKNKYYVYVGITGNVNNISKIKNMYESKGYSIYEKQIDVNNEEFINNIDQFDILVDSTKNNNDISTIEEVILANYEDLIQNS